MLHFRHYINGGKTCINISIIIFFSAFQSCCQKHLPLNAPLNSYRTRERERENTLDSNQLESRHTFMSCASQYSLGWAHLQGKSWAPVSHACAVPNSLGIKVLLLWTSYTGTGTELFPSPLLNTRKKGQFPCSLRTDRMKSMWSLAIPKGQTKAEMYQWQQKILKVGT